MNIPEGMQIAVGIGIADIESQNIEFEKKLSEYRTVLKSMMPEFLHGFVDELVKSPKQVTINVRDDERNTNMFVHIRAVSSPESKYEEIRFNYSVWASLREGSHYSKEIVNTNNPYIALAVFYGAEPPKG